MAEPSTPPETASPILRLVVYSHVFGVICAVVAARLDGIATRHPWQEMIGVCAAFIAVVTLFACPLLCVGILVTYRGQLNDRDLFGVIVLECLIVIAQSIALLPMVQ